MATVMNRGTLPDSRPVGSGGDRVTTTQAPGLSRADRRYLFGIVAMTGYCLTRLFL